MCVSYDRISPLRSYEILEQGSSNSGAHKDHLESMFNMQIPRLHPSMSPGSVVWVEAGNLHYNQLSGDSDPGSPGSTIRKLKPREGKTLIHSPTGEPQPTSLACCKDQMR